MTSTADSTTTRCLSSNPIRSPWAGCHLETTPDSIYIHELQLLPSYQGGGLGTAVVRRVIAEGVERGVPVMLSVVPANHRAQRLYERLGFKVTGIEAPFIRMRWSSFHPNLV